MQTKNIYASYGVLSHEKRPVYTADTPASEIHEIVSVTLPDGWAWAENAAGASLITSPDGETWLANDILSNYGDQPCLRWYDGSGEHRKMLNIVA